MLSFAYKSHSLFEKKYSLHFLDKNRTRKIATESLKNGSTQYFCYLFAISLHFQFGGMFERGGI